MRHLDAEEDLVSLMEETLGVQRKMAESIIHQRAEIIAVQNAVLAIAEQLSASGSLDVQIASKRLLEMSDALTPQKMKDLGVIQRFAERLHRLQKPLDPLTPAGSKPRSVN